MDSRETSVGISRKRSNGRLARGAAVVEAVYAIGFFLVLVGGCFDMYLRFMSRSEAEMKLLDFARAVEISPTRDQAYLAANPDAVYSDIRTYDPAILTTLDSDLAVKAHLDKLKPSSLSFNVVFDGQRNSLRIVYVHKAKCFFCLRVSGEGQGIAKGGGYWSGQQTVEFEKPIFDFDG